MAGRPNLRIGQHGKINRKNLGGGIWVAKCRYRDSDGVVRIVERRGPADEYDKHGKLAADALIEALQGRRAPSDLVDAVGPETPVMQLVERHLERLEEDKRSPATLGTYKLVAEKLKKFLGGVRVREASTARLDAAIRSMRTAHGATMAKQAKTILRGGLQLAVMANVISANPVRDVSPIRMKTPPNGAPALTVEQLRHLVKAVQASEYCAEHDLADPITLLIATGMRRSELLALRWSDFDADAGTLTIAAKLIRATGYGLQRVNETKTAAGYRTISLPTFATTMLEARQGRQYLGEHPMIFPSTAGTWRDPNNFGKQWRAVREHLGLPEVTSHSFRKTVVTLIDEEGLSARIAADQVGHSQISMTQDKYMARKRPNSVVADLLDRTINDE